MILIDTNLLLYASISDFAQHAPAKRWLNEQFSGTERIGIPWHSVLGYVRLASQKTVFKKGPSVNEAWSVARKWLALGNVWVPQPTERHGDVLNDLLVSNEVSSRFIMDLHLAALAIEHDLTVCSNDSDFARLANVRWINPLVA
ncbi:MAG TPA: TA system VapC family ribonuclease toxin [Rhizomicrobium sp.]|nr:TA system VapC family ribonuclease toxin [Rhizomicrobium sp.]